MPFVTYKILHGPDGRFLPKEQVTLTCQECGKKWLDFPCVQGRRKYCSRDCLSIKLSRKVGKAHHRYKPRPMVICKFCQVKFTGRLHGRSIYCSYSCASKAQPKELRALVSLKAAQTNRVRGVYQKTSERMKHGGAVKALLGNVHTPRASRPQRELYSIIHNYYKTAVLEYPVHGLAVADIAIPELSLDIEYDGEHWHTDKSKDERRDRKLATVGWRTIRVNKYDLTKIRDFHYANRSI